MNAIKILQDQHREVEALFKAFEVTEDGKKRLEIVNALSDALAAHATIEEKIFYPAAQDAETEDLLRESLEEHLSVKRILADLMEMPPQEEQYKAKVKALKEQVLHHVEEEEGEMFPKVRSKCDEEELEQLGAQMESLMAELMAEGEPRTRVPSETDAAPPLA